MPSKIVRFILRPFVGTIRYGTLKIMKKLRPPDDKRPIIATAGYLLDEIILPLAFSIFIGERFREVANFKKLSEAEHDRIFNELEVAGVCLGIFYLRAAKHFLSARDYHFWQDTEEYLSKQLQNILMKCGAERSNAKLMRQLIDIRREEYEEVAVRFWETSNDLMPEFQTLTPEMKLFAARIQATAVGAADHIRRGKIKKGDPLIKFLINWLMLLYQEIRKFVDKL